MITKLKKSVILTTGNGCSNLKQVETIISIWLNDMKTASIVTKQNSGNKPINTPGSYYNYKLLSVSNQAKQIDSNHFKMVITTKKSIWQKFSNSYVFIV